MSLPMYVPLCAGRAEHTTNLTNTKGIGLRTQQIQVLEIWGTAILIQTDLKMKSIGGSTFLPAFEDVCFYRHLYPLIIFLPERENRR